MGGFDQKLDITKEKITEEITEEIVEKIEKHEKKILAVIKNFEKILVG